MFLFFQVEKALISFEEWPYVFGSVGFYYNKYFEWQFPQKYHFLLH